jgi:hypothetical protein
MIQREFTFEDQMKMSEGIGDIEDLQQFLLMHIPYAIRVERASISDDKSGTDYWVTDKFGHRHSVDLKARDHDFGKDDYALETWSVIESQKIGWTRDPSKRTDYIFWYWIDTKRWALVPFLPLCSVFEKRWQEWRKKYKPYSQYTKTGKGWHSECVFVPSRIVWGAMYTAFGGVR